MTTTAMDVDAFMNQLMNDLNNFVEPTEKPTPGMLTQAFAFASTVVDEAQLPATRQQKPIMVLRPHPASRVSRLQESNFWIHNGAWNGERPPLFLKGNAYKARARPSINLSSAWVVYPALLTTASAFVGLLWVQIF